MDNSVDTIKRYQRYFKRLIELERQEEINFHLSEIRSISGPAREKKGRAILDLSGRDFGRGLAGICLVRLTHRYPLPDTEISVGDLVIVSQGNPTGEEPQGVVTEKGNTFLTIACNRQPPAFVFKNRLRLDLFANDVTFRRMLDALSRLREDEVISDLLILKRIPRRTEQSITLRFRQTKLNKSQQQAVIASLQSEDCFLIHGPPGTGKTTTLVESIIQHILQGEKVLVTADSNTAVDNLVEKLMEVQCRVVRAGNPARMNEAIAGASIDHLARDEPDYQQAAYLREFIPELREEQKKFVQPTGPARRGLTEDQILILSRRGATNRGIPLHKIHKMAEWINLQHQVNALHDEARKLEMNAVKHILDTAEAICATNSSSGGELLADLNFDVCFIDEATQSMEPSCLIPMVKAQKWILAGDHLQLPPTVLCDEAGELHFTLFERWIQHYGPGNRAILKIQYRMHEKIMEFSNREFYQGKLTAALSVKHHHIGQLSGFQLPDGPNGRYLKIIDPELPVVFIDVSRGFEEKIKGSFSYFNREEASCIGAITERLLACRLFPADIGIISPYDQQVNNLKSTLSETGIEIKTVDGFQGREKEVILVTLVRSGRRGSLGFLKDYRRLNVALTRARRKLIVAGNRETLVNDPVYGRFLCSVGPIVAWK